MSSAIFVIVAGARRSGCQGVLDVADGPTEGYSAAWIRLGKKAVASVEWLVARNFWISWYWGLGAFRSGALPDVYELEKRALHWWRRMLLFIPVTAVPEAPGGRALDY